MMRDIDLLEGKRLSVEMLLGGSMVKVTRGGVLLESVELEEGDDLLDVISEITDDYELTEGLQSKLVQAVEMERLYGIVLKSNTVEVTDLEDGSVIIYDEVSSDTYDVIGIGQTGSTIMKWEGLSKPYKTVVDEDISVAKSLRHMVRWMSRFVAAGDVTRVVVR